MDGWTAVERGVVLGLDLTPLRKSTAYRRLYAASFITNIGSQASYVIVAFQMKQVTHSTWDVGAIGLVELIPLVVFGLYGGVLADHFDRRRLVVACESAKMAVSLTLLVNALQAHPAVWLLYVVVAIGAGLDGLQRPSLTAMNQSLVDHELQREMNALGMFRFTIGAIVGPSLGGVLAANFGTSTVYGLDALTFVASLALLLRLPSMPSSLGNERPSLESLRMGLRYAMGRRDLLGTYIIDLAAMILAFPVVMLPFVADRFSETYALAVLYAAMPAGALIGSLISGIFKNVHRFGRATALAAAAWGAGIAVFGYTNVLAVAVAGLVFGGIADSASAVFRGTMWNQSIPPDVRGRMAGIEVLSYTVGPTLGQFRSGAMAAALGLRSALTLGGLLCSGVCLALPSALPALWRFDDRSDPNVAYVSQLRSSEGSDET